MELNDEFNTTFGSNNITTAPAKRHCVGLIYDERMCKHATPDNESHPENPNRIRVIWDLLTSSGLAKRCMVLDAKKAADNELALVHTKNHINLIKNIVPKSINSKRKRIASKFDSIYFNKGSSEAAYLSAGSVIEVAEKVAKGELDSAFAIVRPPGHHAEEDEPMGFCLFNNVAIATSFLLNERPELGIKKILIVDWDVHHGNGTQKMFYKDPRVLVFSVHRHESGNFYPSGEDGSYGMIGDGPGVGYNINVPWENGGCGDADYLAVWDHILLPIAKEFNPDMILISAGFDAAVGDPLGGCCVSPSGYATMLYKLMEFAGGKIVMALEGGYNLESLANSVHACVEVLLQQKLVTGSLEASPFESTWCVIQAVRQKLSAYWPILATKVPVKIISRTSPVEKIVVSADEDAETIEFKKEVSKKTKKSTTNSLLAEPMKEMMLLLYEEKNAELLSKVEEATIKAVQSAVEKDTIECLLAEHMKVMEEKKAELLRKVEEATMKAVQSAVEKNNSLTILASSVMDTIKSLLAEPMKEMEEMYTELLRKVEEATTKAVQSAAEKKSTTPLQGIKAFGKSVDMRIEVNRLQAALARNEEHCLKVINLFQKVSDANMKETKVLTDISSKHVQIHSKFKILQERVECLKRSIRESVPTKLLSYCHGAKHKVAAEQNIN